MSEHISRTAVSTFLIHLHPRKVDAETIRFTLSFGLGGMAVTLFCTLVFTGLLQLLSYAPDMNRAYGSVQDMYSNGNLSGFVRNIHYWSGNLLVVVCFLHMLRVFLTGAFTGGRRFNWVVGVLLFGLILSANFTGYLLPNDQLAYWAVTIFTSMLSYMPLGGHWLMTTVRGGAEVGPETFSSFFAIHVGLLPVAALLLIVYHFWLIRKARGLIRPPQFPADHIEMVDAVPHLVFRELAVGLSLLAVLFSFGAMVDAPLADPATPGNSPNPAKAAWYFMGLQELLLHLHPTVVICILPLLTVVGLLLLPFLKNAVLPGGIWFGGAQGRKVALWSSLAGFLCAGGAVVLDSVFSASNAAIPDHLWLNRGVLPLVAAGVVLAGWYALWRKQQRCTRAEATMALMIFIAGSIVSLTLVGCWFRGEGMVLVLPIPG